MGVARVARSERAGVVGAYVGGAKLLLCADDGTGALGSIQGALALDDSLTLGSTRAARLAANLGDGIPFRHGGSGGGGGGG